MKKLRFFDSLKFVRLVVAVVAATLILNVAHADTTINSVIAYGKTEQSGTPTPTNPVPIMTNNGVLKVRPNLFDGKIELGSIDPSNGSLVENSSRTRSKNFIRVEPNTTYTFIRENPNGIRWIVGYNENKVGITDGNFSSQASAITNMQAASIVTKTFTTSPTTYYIKWYNTSNAGLKEKVKMFQGTSADEVYVDGLTETIRDSAGHTATAQMLLSVGDYKDEQNITTGAITRRVGVKVLDGTENWMRAAAGKYFCSMQAIGGKTSGIDNAKIQALSNFFKSISWNTVDTGGCISIRQESNMAYLRLSNFSYDDVSELKQYLADQYANGTPVIVVYPLETETPEPAVAPQTLTTAPVRQTAGSILGMPIEVVLGDGTREWVSEMITIATTRYNEESFAPVKTDLSAAMNAVDDVVTRTMSQAQAIDTIATTKQTRPDESCPPFKKCLLVEDEQGTPHWYEIYDPINDFLNPILAAAGLSGNQGAPIMTTHTENGSTIIDTSNIFYNGSGAFKKKYIDNTTSASDRPFGPATGPDELPRCADNATRTTAASSAGICYDTGGMFRTLTEGADGDAGEWALVWNGAEGGASLGITPGVVYGVAKCTSVGQHTTQITGDVPSGSEYWWPEKLTGYTGGDTTLASLIEQYPNSDVETVFNTLPNPYGTTDSVEYPRDNFQNCWCKMTAIGVPGSGDTPDQRYANGTIMSVSGGWVFDNASTSATSCAINCAYYCANHVRARAAYRKNVLTVR